MRGAGVAAALVWTLSAAAAERTPVDSRAADESAALAAAEGWLGLLDAGKYEESWRAAAPLFQLNVPKEQWTFAAMGARGPLGRLKERKRHSTTWAESLPGAPDGVYLVVEFQSAFAQKAAAVERVTMARTAPGEWRAAGYFIR
jgi:hypothetical protein